MLRYDKIEDLRTFHREIERLVKDCEMKKRDAWIRVEVLYFKKKGKNRYKNYKSFRIMHYRVIRWCKNKS